MSNKQIKSLNYQVSFKTANQLQYEQYQFASQVKHQVSVQIYFQVQNKVCIQMFNQVNFQIYSQVEEI